MIKKEFEDYKRNLKRKWDNNEYFIYGVQIENIFNWKNSILKINYPICLLTGINGSGKSTLINSLKHINNIQKNEAPQITFSSIKDYTIKVLNKEGKEIISKDNSLTKREFDLPQIYDITFDTRLYSFYRASNPEEQDAFLEALGSLDQETLPLNLLSLLREITRKDIISALRIIDEEDKREYYAIELKDKTIYDSYTMGSGEFYVNQLLWRLKELPEKCIVVIEELENFVHCEAQKKILEILHEYSVKKGIQFILTTHSPTIINNSTEESRILVKLDSENNVICLNDCSAWLARDSLGYTNNGKIEVIVEDEKSKKLLETILSLKDSSLYHCILVNPVGPDSLIQKICDCTTNLKIRNLIGVIDGDSPIHSDENKNLLKLPWSESIEKLVLNLILKNIDEVSKQLSISPENIKTILQAAMLLTDFHEWVTEISTKLGVDNNFLWECFVRIWYKENESTSEMKDFYVIFKKIFDKLITNS